MKEFLGKNKTELIIVVVALLLFLIIGAVILFMPLDKFVITDEVSLRVLDESFYYEKEDAHILFSSISQSAMQRYKMFIILDFVILGIAGAGMYAAMSTLTEKRVMPLAIIISLIPSVFNFVENILTLRAINYFPEFRAGLLDALSIFTTLKWCTFIIWGLTFIALIIRKVIENKKR